MKPSIFDFCHCAYLKPDEEERFMKAIAQKYKTAHGNVAKAIHEAIIDWIQKIEGEK